MDRHFDPAYVREAYDRFAESYDAGRGAFDNRAQLEALDRLLPRGARVLDLGCGTGQPVARFFAGSGHAVTGIDVSPHMIELARAAVPGATFLVGDVRGLSVPPGSFDLVVSLYALFHLDRASQLALLPRVHEALAPGGHFYATWADREYTGAPGFEGTKEFQGVELPYAEFEPGEYRGALEAAGFADVRAHKLTLGGETMLWILCRR